MRIGPWLATAALATIALTAATHDAHAAAPPRAGTYLAQGIVTSVAPTGGATHCPAVGDFVGFFLQYPGPAADGAAILSTIQFEHSVVQQIGTMPTTPPAVGSRNWAGTLRFRDSAGNKWPVTFFGKVQYFTDSMFLIDVTKWNEVQLTGGSCNQTMQLSLTRNGDL